LNNAEEPSFNPLYDKENDKKKGSSALFVRYSACFEITQTDQVGRTLAVLNV
jgi:hypothetical protein